MSALRFTASRLCRPQRVRSTIAQTPLPRFFGAVNENEDYDSPLKALFERMERNGPTALGTIQPIELPDKVLECGVRESDLRFSTTTYGRTLTAPFVHPNEHRVTLKVNISKLPLNETELLILREIVGSRYNEERGVLRISSGQFGSRIENKRHLVSMLNRIVLSCQRLAKQIQDEEKNAV